MNKILENLLYAKTHEWVEFIDETTVRIGISDFAQQELGDLVFVNLPEVGDAVTAGIAFGDVESVKAVSDVISPVTGTVTEINEELLGRPELINEDAYENWFIKVEDIAEQSELMSPAEYGVYCEKEAHG
ncbi:MAG: glycine cleavage system protein GcvH [Tannerella sp.]|jgi:glycine cleavage system H protein|nr:glycine cleavage system protein GcvH [Tannerella sp.]